MWERMYLLERRVESTKKIKSTPNIETGREVRRRIRKENRKSEKNK